MSSVEAGIRQWFDALRHGRHPLLDGDPDAEPILHELVNDSSYHVRTFATIGLQKIEALRTAAPTGS